MRVPRHGDIKVSTLPIKHAKRHLSDMTVSMNEVKDYGSHGDIGQSSQGGFTGSSMSGGASNAEYTTNSADNMGDADSMGPSDY